MNTQDVNPSIRKTLLQRTLSKAGTSAFASIRAVQDEYGLLHIRAKQTVVPRNHCPNHIEAPRCPSQIFGRITTTMRERPSQ